MKKICVFTSNRADYFKLEPIIKYLNNNSNFKLYLIVIGTHLVYDFGPTVELIKYPIYAKVNTILYSDNEKSMAESCSIIMSKTPQLLDLIKPDAILIHGDRFDIVGVALTSALMNICLIHIEGGELTGTIDEHLRHSISKLATYHLVSNNNAKEILIKMGENPNNIFIMGCPAVDTIINLKKNIKYLDEFKIEENKYIISIFHPVVTNLKNCLKQYQIFLDALIESRKTILFFYPNIDKGSKQFIRLIRRSGLEKNKSFKCIKTLDFEKYISILNYSGGIIGNSSSGIREACTLGVGSIDIGTRQNNRLKSENTISLLEINNKNQIIDAINIMYGKKFKQKNLYGSGKAIEKFDYFINNVDFTYKEKNFYNFK